MAIEILTRSDEGNLDSSFFRRIKNLEQYYASIFSSSRVSEYSTSHLVESFNEISDLRNWFEENEPNLGDCRAIYQVLQMISTVPTSTKKRISCTSLIGEPDLEKLKDFFESQVSHINPRILAKVFYPRYN